MAVALVQVCLDCKEEKSTADFQRAGKDPDKLMAYCRKCMGLRAAADHENIGPRRIYLGHLWWKREAWIARCACGWTSKPQSNRRGLAISYKEHYA